MKLGNDIYQIRAFSDILILDKLVKNKITIYNWKKVGEYTYQFESSIINRKKIKKVFKDINIIKSEGFLNSFIFLWLEKTTLIALIVSTMFYLFLGSRLWKIEILGQYDYINSLISEELDKYKIKQGVALLSYQKLKEVENKIYADLEEDIEWLELSNKGSSLKVNYLKRRKKPDQEAVGGKLFASKNGLIAKIEVSNGQVMVKENQYVLKGDLLVDDTIVSTSGEEIFIGTSGKIYAYTWYVVTIEMETTETDEAEIFSLANNKALEQIRKELKSDEHIEKENILLYSKKDNIITMKIHYTLYEDISS